MDLIKFMLNFRLGMENVALSFEHFQEKPLNAFIVLPAVLFNLLIPSALLLSFNSWHSLN